MQPTDDSDQRALDRAERMEQNVTSARRDEEAAVKLMNRLDRLATSLFEHAKVWDRVNPERAAKVREEHDKVRALFLQVEEMAENEAEGITAMLTEIEKTLRELNHGDQPA